MQLSTSALNIFAECKRCFFLDKKLKAPRPRGIFPSLPGGVDGILKNHLENWRGQLPPELNIPQLKGWRLFEDAEKLAKYRQWNSKDALKYKDAAGNVLVGGLDDILAGEDVLAPLDYKTKGSEPTQEDCEKYYQRQLDIYALLLSTKYDVAEFGVLLYFWPEVPRVEDEDVLVRFESKAFILSTSAARAKALFEEALDLLAQEDLPTADPACEYCKCHSVRSESMIKALAGGR